MTAITKQNLLHLAQVYDLSPFFYTKNIRVQSEVVSHSHPVLTLNTKNAEDPKKLLSIFLHEELHWWLHSRPKEMAAAVKQLKKIYPKAPITKGSGKDSTYLHLLVCYLELKAVGYYLGKIEARKIITSLMKDDKFYPWIYFQILNKDSTIKAVMQKNKLIPDVLLETNKKSVTLTR
jgi:hypothetical protein